MEACLIALLFIALLSATAFGQSSTASLGGTVMDASRAVLPGANITAVNESTGIETRVATNSSGVYNFASLQPGTYRVTAELSGFQRSTRTEVRLGAGAQLRLDFDMVVAGITTEVEVVSTVEHMVLESGSSTGTVVQHEMVVDLPLVANDAMDLLKIMGGVVGTTGASQSLAGVAAYNINITRDGISVSELRFNSGVVSPARINPDMVGEFKMIMSPVDAELGRGAGQVQITTRSGSNTFHGSGVWNIQNTALDAYDYNAKDVAPEFVAPLPWRNLNNYTLTASGPIIRNRTFFFVSWDQAISRGRESVVSTVLTPCARKGIYRWLDGTRNVNASTLPSVISGPAGSTPQRPVVDVHGDPLYAYQFPTGSQYGVFSGQLHTANLNYQ
ncbi:MAG: carboxypeptidase-like regulatory domain-containing protein, partial [Acidobacteriota bacterium]|nr:carboxypeptidase-like regulatory domain-containing protein [Acidobacteriota bacterium]